MPEIGGILVLPASLSSPLRINIGLAFGVGSTSFGLKSTSHSPLPGADAAEAIEIRLTHSESSHYDFRRTGHSLRRVEGRVTAPLDY
jgi:hypothetical protein